MNKFLEKIILKIKKKNYYLFRALANLFVNKSIEKDILADIFVWVLKRKLEDNLSFFDIFVFGNKVYIVTDRPGWWIGKGGSVMNELENFINQVQKEKYSIEIIEDKFSSKKLMKIARKSLNECSY